MRIGTIALVLALAACNQQPERREAAAEPPPAPIAPIAPVQQAAMVSLPKDPAQVKRLETMGYTVHEDHLHAPGVSVCPKMSDDPVM